MATTGDGRNGDKPMVWKGSGVGRKRRVLTYISQRRAVKRVA